jgi:hypothetical protein
MLREPRLLEQVRVLVPKESVDEIRSGGRIGVAIRRRQVREIEADRYFIVRERIRRTAVAEDDRCRARWRHGGEGWGQGRDLLLPGALAGVDQTFPFALGGAAGTAQGDEGVALGWLVAGVEDGGPEGCGGAGGSNAGDDADGGRVSGFAARGLREQWGAEQEREAGGE